MADKRFVNDAVSLGDEFGTLKLGDRVALMALEADPPFTIGVTGKWGSGKTSVLRRAFITLGGKPLEQAAPLREAIQEDSKDWGKWHWNAEKRQPKLDMRFLGRVAEKSLCVWYSPWQHQKEGNPLVPLLQEIRAQFSAWQKLKNGISDNRRRMLLTTFTLLERAIDGAVALKSEALSAATAGFLGGDKRPARLAEGTTKAVSEVWDREQPLVSRQTDGQRFQLLFEDAVETMLKNFKAKSAKPGEPAAAAAEKLDGRLIIFIDDLDRCEERVIVELLEAIKLYLGTHRCVFVLGLDENAVAEALGRHWSGRAEDTNREYLEKLFQAILPLPPAREEAAKKFIEEQFRKHDLRPEADLAQMVGDLLEPNPRRIKNFVNSACAMWQLFDPNYGKKRTKPTDEDTKRAKRFLLLAYLRSHHRAVWRLLERQPWSLRFLTWVLNNGTKATMPQIKNVDPEAQRLLTEYFRRSFSHIGRNWNESEKGDVHGHFSLERAVDLFQGRIDRKRSDEKFAFYFLEVFEEKDELPAELLYFPAETT